jgi:GNAT superfamily N-acetyltransferase
MSGPTRPPDPELVRDCETAEVAAIRSWFEAIPPDVGAKLGSRHADLGDGLLVRAGPDVLMFNRVLGLGVRRPVRETELDEAVRVFQESGAPRFMIPIAPLARPPEFATWLAARGFHEHNHWIRLVRDLTEPLPEPRTDLRVAPFGTEHAETFGRMEAEAFGHPPELAELNSCLVGRPGWSFVGAFEGETLVSVAGMHVQGAAAWFGFASTRAEYRGRGAQSALIAWRLAAARGAGCRWACVETAADTPEKPNPSTHNLRRAGFRDAYERPNWVKVLREG